MARLKADFPRAVFVCVHFKRKNGEFEGGICNHLSSSAIVEVVHDRHRMLAVLRKSRGSMVGYGLGLEGGEIYLPREFTC